MNEEYTTAAARLRRKLEVLRLDFKASDNNRKYDIDECLMLLNIMERNTGEATQSATANVGGVEAVSSGSSDL